ncbi:MULTISPECIES: hypothetical protein [unclassified Photobacterium]|uniref:hypothetical protein n=1 Tax=unclassified Photobacterium TaxID=2628852 RepID=UPI001EDD5882|nr:MULTISPECIES: hypothetical protein [unclassified Photobacterium]MCG3865705.1 hypothetical protein [Photobacterium sp. Ph6]MCG3877206.1 hypothetical protein [Photobacterium sp. Ph5]
MKSYQLMLLLITFTFAGCLSESPSEQTNQPIEAENDISNDVQPPLFFPVKDSDDDINDIDNDINDISDEALDEQDKENFPILDASDINFSGNVRTIPISITNPITEDVYVNVYRDYSIDETGSYVLNHADRVIATAVIEATYEGYVFLTPDINKLLIEIISLDNNKIITQQKITFPIENIKF